jgi:hypothetical protein
MRRTVLGVLAVLVTLLIVAVPTYAASTKTASVAFGPYEGTFQGVAYGDRGSRAPLTLELTHRGDDVVGKMSLGEGLYFDGGVCGKVDLPAIEQDIVGQTQIGDPRQLVASPTFDAGGFNLEVEFESRVLGNGDVIFATAEADLPWFCGRDVSLLAIAYRTTE